MAGILDWKRERGLWVPRVYEIQHLGTCQCCCDAEWECDIWSTSRPSEVTVTFADIVNEDCSYCTFGNDSFDIAWTRHVDSGSECRDVYWGNFGSGSNDFSVEVTFYSNYEGSGLYEIQTSVSDTMPPIKCPGPWARGDYSQSGQFASGQTYTATSVISYSYGGYDSCDVSSASCTVET